MNVSRLSSRRSRGRQLAAAAALLLVFVLPGAAAAVTDPLNTPTYNNADANYWSPHQNACYQFVGSGWTTTYDNLHNQIQAEMLRLALVQIGTGARADLPFVTTPCYSGDNVGARNMLGSVLNIEFGTNGGGETPNAYEIQLDPTPTNAWCTTLTATGSCSPIDSGLVHELGHALGLEHSYPFDVYNDRLDRTRMNMVLRTANYDAGGRVFGHCDVAGLQARYGLPTSTTPLSICFSTFTPTVQIAQATVGGYVTITATVTINWTIAQKTTTWWDSINTCLASKHTLATTTCKPKSGTERITGLQSLIPQVQLRETTTGDALVGTMTGVIVTPGTYTYTYTLPAYSGNHLYYARLTGLGSDLPTTSSLVILVSG